MKKILVLFLIIFAMGAFAKYNEAPLSEHCMHLKEFADSVNWTGTESTFVYDFKSNVIPSTHQEWDYENSESNFSVVNICVDSIKVKKSHIRVSKITKKLICINLIALEDEMDEKKSLAIINSIIDDFGKPLKIVEERDKFIASVTKNYYWESPDYDFKIDLFYISDSNGTQNIVIRLEPY